MTRLQVMRTGTLLWAALGASVALSSLGNVNADARVLVGFASVVGPLLAVWAALQLSRHAARSAGVLLILSAVLTPTYFTYAIGVPALIVGLVLTVAPEFVLPHSQGPVRASLPKRFGA